ncbi:MAG: DASS family sodium-coupled anion symporter [Bacteroidetes bacterium]|nr:DASS family sodium-coupled anion symporter [Bacteroidota bacterium]
MAQARSLQSPGSLRGAGLILGAVLFIAILLLPSPEGLHRHGLIVLALAVLMAVWWMTEALPIPVTSLLPLLLLPLFGVSSVQETARPYAHELVFLFLGGFVIAMAVERSGLHKRIALRIILLVGAGPAQLVLGFMLATAFLSMWISNTATVMLMLPIALAVVEQMRHSSDAGAGTHFPVALLLGIAYAASIGGIATLIGTPPNIVLAGVLAQLYPEAPTIGFVQWMQFGIPVAAVFLPLCWLLLVRVLPATRLDRGVSAGMGRGTIQHNLGALGRMRRMERLVLSVFLLTAAGWIFRSPLDLGVLRIPGLTDLFPALTDTSIAISAAVLLFLLPGERGGMLFSWQEIQRGIPWGILLLFGGGFALAGAMQSSGVTLFFGERLSELKALPLPVMILLTCLLLTFLTELTSNTATASILIPVMAATALSLGQHPLLLMLPAALNASFAFMLPVATPPNAIVFSSSRISIRTMAKTGVTLNFLGVFLVTLMMYALGMSIFGITVDSIPVWAR